MMGTGHTSCAWASLQSSFTSTTPRCVSSSRFRGFDGSTHSAYGIAAQDSEGKTTATAGATFLLGQTGEDAPAPPLVEIVAGSDEEPAFLRQVYENGELCDPSDSFLDGGGEVSRQAEVRYRCPLGQGDPKASFEPPPVFWTERGKPIVAVDPAEVSSVREDPDSNPDVLSPPILDQKSAPPGMAPWDPVAPLSRKQKRELASVEEEPTCRYVLEFHEPGLCFHPEFQRRPPNPPQRLRCRAQEEWFGGWDVPQLPQEDR